MAGSAGSERLDALVLDLDTRAGLWIARSAAGSGLRVAVAARDAAAPGMRTRHAVARAALPPPEQDVRAYGDALVAFLQAHPADTVVPSIDSSLTVLHERRDELSPLTSPAVGSREAVELASSKSRTAELARDLGVPTPRAIRVESAGDVEVAAGELGYPAVLKPETSWNPLGDGGERLGPVYLLDAETARTAGAALAGAPALVQEVVPGERQTIKLFRVEGRVIARFAMSAARTWPPLGGSSVLRRSIPLPADALAHAERLIDSTGLDGYSEVEFRRDAKGRPVLMEINARLSQSVELAARAGVDFARMQIDWARGRDVPPVDGYRTGVRLGWAAGELRLLAGALLGSPPPRPRLGDLAPALIADYGLGRTRIEGVDLRDPGPMLASLAFTARSLRRRGTPCPSASRG